MPRIVGPIGDHSSGWDPHMSSVAHLALCMSVQVWDDVFADEGNVWCHWQSLDGKQTGRKASRFLYFYRQSRRWPGDNNNDSCYSAGTPWNDLCASRVHIWCSPKQQRCCQGRYPLGCRQVPGFPLADVSVNTPPSESLTSESAMMMIFQSVLFVFFLPLPFVKRLVHGTYPWDSGQDTKNLLLIVWAPLLWWFASNHFFFCHRNSGWERRQNAKWIGASSCWAPGG